MLSLVMGAALPHLGKAQAPANNTAQTQSELEAVKQKLDAHQQAGKRLEQEIASIKSDRTKLNAALIETAQKTRALEEQIRDLEERLETLTGSETAIQDSLNSRRAVIAEVLAALQRMGRKPPPAVLAQPEDMLLAVRTSILLGAVLPELRAETNALANDLTELVRLKKAIATDRYTLNTQLTSLTDQQQRVAALMEARQSRQSEVEAAIGSERQKMAELATQAKSLADLIERSEKEVAGAQRAAAAARQAETMQQKAAFAATAFTDPSRLSPKIPFAQAKGRLPLPVSGEQVKDFGGSDGYGGTMRGISLSTRAKAVVVSPSDGWVAFAGPFRSFGRLLIINAGGGYYVLLAGMDQINVEVGQFVLAGEPVAIMGEQALPSAVAGSIETKDPVLYVELRKDGGSIDPGPWWAKSQSEKVRG
ncbi:peptidoglycan DD-metalloendopeptidase family protein [Microvirga sp. W0021]|uniref:Peptidoglycan DD-metalloendopeptidase family protein n=1 Tax=Hohaiivirga grylli TaxID=3133970 RepID=A0ABV0BEN7_9HYPH